MDDKTDFSNAEVNIKGRRGWLIVCDVDYEKETIKIPVSFTGYTWVSYDNILEIRYANKHSYNRLEKQK